MSTHAARTDDDGRGRSVVKLPTFDEMGTLALFLDGKADGAETYARSAMNEAVARRYREEAVRFRRAVEVLGWIGQREDRLHILTEPVRRETRYGGAS